MLNKMSSFIQQQKKPKEGFLPQETLSTDGIDIEDWIINVKLFDFITVRPQESKTLENNNSHVIIFLFGLYREMQILHFISRQMKILKRLVLMLPLVSGILLVVHHSHY